MRAVCIILTLAAVVWAYAPGAAKADIIDDVRAAFTSEEAQDDPFLPIYELYKTRAQEAEASGNLVDALEYYRIAATIDRRDRESITAARKVKQELDARAAKRLEKGLALLESGDKDAAQAELSGSLRLNPDDTTAVPYLKNSFGAQVVQEYVIEQGDTLRRVSEKVYDNPGGELLLTRINNLSIADSLKPGDTLKVPVVSKALAKRLQRLAAVAPAPKKAAAKAAEATAAPQAAVPVEEDLVESEAQDAGALLSMAKLQFGRGLYSTAVSMADELLAQEPGNMAAQDIRNESYYKLADKNWNDGSSAEAMRMIIRLPQGYKDSADLKKKIQAKLDADSEPLYLAGVKYFLSEDLEKAVEQWELTLQVNPFHNKARQDLEKARQLLEAVKGI